MIVVFFFLLICLFFFFNDTATTEIYTLSLHDALPIFFSLDSVQEFNRKIDIDSEKILTVGKFAIVTGINPNWPNADGKIFPCFIKHDEIISKTNCDVFDISKA